MDPSSGDDDTNCGEPVNCWADDGYLATVDSCLAEWNSPEDDEAFRDL